MNKKTIFLTMIVFTFIISSLMVSATPRIPVQLYGDVQGVSQGTQVVISINGVEEEVSLVQNNRVGHSHLIFLRRNNPDTSEVEGLAGDGNDIISFKFPGYEEVSRNYSDPSQEVYYVNILASELIAEPECTSNADCPSNHNCVSNQCERITGNTPSGGGGGRRGGTPYGDEEEFIWPCISKWVCNEWSPCVGNIQTRECIKEFPCNDSSIRPPERIACGEVEDSAKPIYDSSFENRPVTTQPIVHERTYESDLIEKEKRFMTLPRLIFFLLLLLLIIGAILIYYQNKMVKQNQINNYKTNKSLDKYIQDTLKKGFTQKQITEALIRKGWDKNQIDEYFKNHNKKVNELDDEDINNSNMKEPLDTKKLNSLSSILKKNLDIKKASEKSKEITSSDKNNDVFDRIKERKDPLKLSKSPRIKVKEYIDATLEKGFTKEEIKESLLKKGWKPDYVDKYLYEDVKRVKSEKSNEKTISKKSSKNKEAKKIGGESRPKNSSRNNKIMKVAEKTKAKKDSKKKK